MTEATSEMPPREDAPAPVRIVAEKDQEWVEELPPDRSEAFEWEVRDGRYPTPSPPSVLGS